MSNKQASMKNTAGILLVAICIFYAPIAKGWGVTGHRVVAEIASHHLSNKTKKGLKEILGGESLAWWSNYPDFLKSDTTKTWNHTFIQWHILDLAGHIPKQTFIDSLKLLTGENLYTQIPAMMAQVKDKSLPLEKRKVALAFLVHLVGDLHQPLHVGRDEDQGGNKIPVTWFEKKTNLHTVWDSELIGFQQYSYTEYAKLIDIADKTTVDAWQQTGLEEWLWESHALSDRIYDMTPADSKLGYKYNYIFQKVLDAQLLKGGLRLAKLLNECFQ
jgi:hypothetical protein